MFTGRRILHVRGGVQHLLESEKKLESLEGQSDTDRDLTVALVRNATARSDAEQNSILATSAILATGATSVVGIMWGAMSVWVG